MIIYILARGTYTVCVGLDDILLTAASDSRISGLFLADALPPSGQERGLLWARGLAFTCHWEALSGLARWAPRVSSVETRERSLAALIPAWKEEAAVFSAICIRRSRSWKQLFSSPLITNAPAAASTTLVGSVGQGYKTAIPVVEETLASHLSPSLAPSWSPSSPSN